MDASAPLKQCAVSAAVFGVLCRMKHGIFTVAQGRKQHQTLRRRINDMIALLLSLNIIERTFKCTYRITNDGEDYIQLVASPVCELTEFDSFISTLVYSISGYDAEKLSALKPKRRRTKPYKSGDIRRCRMQPTIQSVMAYLANPQLHQSPISRENRCAYVVLAGLRALGALTAHNEETMAVSQWFVRLNEIYTRPKSVANASPCISPDSCASSIPDFGVFDPSFSFDIETI